MTAAKDPLAAHGLTLTDAVEISSAVLASDTELMQKCFRCLPECLEKLFREAQKSFVTRVTFSIFGTIMEPQVYTKKLGRSGFFEETKPESRVCKSTVDVRGFPYLSVCAWF